MPRSHAALPDMDAGSIVFLPVSAVAHDPAVLGPFDGGARPQDIESQARAGLPPDMARSGQSSVEAQRTAAAAVEAIALGRVCPPARSDVTREGPGAQPASNDRSSCHPAWHDEPSFDRGSNVSSRSELQHMLDGIPPPDSDDDDDGSASSPSPRTDDGEEVNGSGCQSRAWANHTQQEWLGAGWGGSNDMGRPLINGSRYPPEQQQTIELQALMRAKDRDLRQGAKQIEDLKMQVEDLQRDRDMSRSRSADWEAKARDWECENTALRQELGQAKSTISLLEEQSQQLQAELSKATGSVNELQIRVDELLQGEALITASQYEHHLNRLRAEAHDARSESERWRQDAAELRAMLDDAVRIHPAGRHICPSEAQNDTRAGISVLDVASQTDVVGALGGAEGVGDRGRDKGNLVAQHLKAEPAESPALPSASAANAASLDALQAQVRALELEVEMLRRAPEAKETLGVAQAASAESASAAAGCKAAAAAAVAASSSLVEQLQQEFVELSSLNTHLIAANRALAKANEALVFESAELKRQVASSSAPPASSGAACVPAAAAAHSGTAAKGMGGGGEGMSHGSLRGEAGVCAWNLSAAEERRMGRVRLEEEARRLRADYDDKLAVALQECERKLKEKFAARETMLMEDKRAEIGRLRAAWSKHTQESIRAVEDRCARESAEALAAVRADLESARAAEAAARVRAAAVDAAVQVQDSSGDSEPLGARARACEVEIQTEELLHHGGEGSAAKALAHLSLGQSGLPCPRNLFDSSASKAAVHESRARAAPDASRALLPAAATATAEAGEEAVNIVLSLNMNLSDVKDWAQFQKEVQADVVWATGVDASKIVVQNLRHGSVLVDMSVAADVRHVIRDLQQQCQDEGSTLRRGRHTRFATCVSLADSHAELPPSATPSPAAHSSAGVPTPGTAAPAAPHAAAHDPAGASAGELDEIRRAALIEKMQQLQQCREHCRAETAAAVAALRRTCVAEMEAELAVEARRVREECEAQRAQARAEVAAEQERVVEEREEQLARRQQEVEAQLVALQQQQAKLAADAAAVEEQVRRQEAARAMLEEESEADLAARREVHKESLDQLNEEWSQRLEETVAACEAEMEAVREACHAERRKCDEEVAACEAEVTALLARHEQEMGRAEGELERLCQEMSEQWESQRREMKQQWHEERETERVAAEEELAQVRQQYQVALQALDHEHEKTIRSAQADAAARVQAIEAECRERLDEFVQEVEREEAVLQGRQVEMMAAAEREVEARLDEVAQECRKKKEELERRAEDTLRQLTEDVEREEARLEESRESLRRARREADEQCARLKACAADELQGHLAQELESELAGLRLHHDRLLSQRRQHEEEGFNRACADMKKQVAERLVGERARAEENFAQEKTRLEEKFVEEKARLKEEFEKESCIIREELTVKDTLALADLHKMLALDRRRASLLAIDEAVKAAETVRLQVLQNSPVNRKRALLKSPADTRDVQTEGILQDELRREIEGMQATHAVRRHEKVAAVRSAHDVELQQLAAELERDHARRKDELRASKRRAADAERTRIQVHTRVGGTRFG